MLLLFIGCLIVLDLTRPKPLLTPVACAAPVSAPLAPHAPVVALEESDVPARPLMDPVPDPYDDKVYHCKEGHKKEGIPAFFSSIGERTHLIDVPAPPAASLLALGLLLIRGACLRRKHKRVTLAGGPL